ncbi:hypothetical protein Tco_0037771 [Tanacetum coccineum]
MFKDSSCFKNSSISSSRIISLPSKGVKEGGSEMIELESPLSVKSKTFRAYFAQVASIRQIWHVDIEHPQAKFQVKSRNDFYDLGMLRISFSLSDSCPFQLLKVDDEEVEDNGGAFLLTRIRQFCEHLTLGYLSMICIPSVGLL